MLEFLYYSTVWLSLAVMCGCPGCNFSREYNYSYMGVHILILKCDAKSAYYRIAEYFRGANISRLVLALSAFRGK